MVDAQLPPALARLLTDRGHIAGYVIDIGLGDKALLDWFEPLIDRIAESVTAGNRVVELR